VAGSGPAAGGFDREDPAPATAAEAIAALERAHALWQCVLQELPDASWWAPLGAAAGPYAEDDKASLVLHQLDEQIHHGAELGVLRDLYAARSRRLKEEERCERTGTDPAGVGEHQGRLGQHGGAGDGGRDRPQPGDAGPV
jgi:hypothetical protein